jgi:hypothetical protein
MNARTCANSAPFSFMNYGFLFALVRSTRDFASISAAILNRLASSTEIFFSVCATIFRISHIRLSISNSTSPNARSVANTLRSALGARRWEALDDLGYRVATTLRAAASTTFHDSIITPVGFTNRAILSDIEIAEFSGIECSPTSPVAEQKSGSSLTWTLPITSIGITLLCEIVGAYPVKVMTPAPGVNVVPVATNSFALASTASILLWNLAERPPGKTTSEIRSTNSMKRTLNTRTRNIAVAGQASDPVMLAINCIQSKLVLPVDLLTKLTRIDCGNLITMNEL